ncbi:MAG: glycosyltransferase [Verrucomicrobia bacterium]|nr:glycosyltransferase [Verrucomicrobiota bacterium]
MTQYPDSWKGLRTVLAHDWLTGMRGGERVLELLCDGFPDAPIYTLLHKQGSVSQTITSHPITTSRIELIPGIYGKYRYFLPFFPRAIESFALPEADLVISTSHCVAKGVHRPKGSRHLCYCFTPMRYAWTFYEEYFGTNPYKRAMLNPMLSRLRKWDHDASGRVDRFVAISQHVRKRINDFYGRDADVVYPPVNTGYYTPSGEDPEDFDLIVSALVPYKKVNLAVEAYTKLGRPLKIIGVGTDTDELKAAAGTNIEFLGWLPDEEVREYYRKCRLLIFPGEEDFGIVPVEAQACGRPVVAFKKGGQLETVIAGETGIFFEEQTADSLIAAVEKATTRHWDPAVIRRQAEKFSIQNFIDGLNLSINHCLKGDTGRTHHG